MGPPQFLRVLTGRPRAVTKSEGGPNLLRRSPDRQQSQGREEKSDDGLFLRRWPQPSWSMGGALVFRSFSFCSFSRENQERKKTKEGEKERERKNGVSTRDQDSKSVCRFSLDISKILCWKKKRILDSSLFLPPFCSCFFSKNCNQSVSLFFLPFPIPKLNFLSQIFAFRIVLVQGQVTSALL